MCFEILDKKWLCFDSHEFLDRPNFGRESKNIGQESQNIGQAQSTTYLILVEIVEMHVKHSQNIGPAQPNFFKTIYIFFKNSFIFELEIEQKTLVHKILPSKTCNRQYSVEVLCFPQN